MTRIIEKIEARRKKYQTRLANNNNNDDGSATIKDKQKDPPIEWYYSFEFFPPKTEAGLENLLTRIERMTRRLEPLFIDVTWGSGGSTSARTLAVASHAQRFCGVDVLMHLTTTDMDRNQIESALQQAKSCGVHNILALRGDPPRGKRSWAKGDVSGGVCDRSVDLVKIIRELHGDYFGIAVAGHPEGHPSSFSLDEEMKHLKEKMDAGADFIITQFFYDVNAFLSFVSRCRDYGITCPIIPGIMPIQSYISLVKMTQYCGVVVPKDILDKVEPVKDDDEAVKEIGCEIAVDMCRQILASDEGSIGVHFYTLNLERSVTRILLSMGALIDIVQPEPEESQNENDDDETKTEKKAEKSSLLLGSSPSTSIVDLVRPASDRKLPWRPSAMARREKEEVRPINWSNRPKSYVMRTEDWDEFPNGRWGDATSPAFGELSDVSHFYSFSLGSDDDRRAMLGHEPKVPEDVFTVFARYVEGDLPHLPWCETPLQPESFLIKRQLSDLNRAGFLTVNSQPAVNGQPSSHKIFGWGGPGGYVYQKEYCECFCSPDRARALVEMVKHNPAINLYAVNNVGEEMRQGLELGGITALTWGVFPNREILQPTIFDPSAFLVWAEEAFSLWSSMWSNLYDYDSESFELIENIRDTYYLVAIIDNDFVSPPDEKNHSDLWQSMLELKF